MENKKTTKTTKRSTKTIVVPTLLEAVERVIAAAEDSKLEDAHLLNVIPEIAMIADGYGITHRQAVLFCACLEKGPNRIDFRDLGNYLNVSKILLRYRSSSASWSVALS